MAVSTPDEAGAADRLLACGRDPVEVVDRARAGTGTEHERSCPHCRATIDADRSAGSAIAALSETEGRQTVPDTLLPNVMRTVWNDLRRATMLALPTETGAAFVAEHTIAAVVEHALDRLTTLQIHSCSARLRVPEERERSDAGPAVAIEVTAAAAYDVDVPAVAAQAREITRRAVTEQFGWICEPIDISIVDIYVSGPAR